jgi:hypothetical protein
MYKSLVSWSVTCVFVSGSFNEAFDDVNLLQAKLSQSSVSEMVQGSRRRTAPTETECLNEGESGKGGKTGKGKGGKGDACQQCPAAEAFCTSVIGYVSDCTAYWQNNPGSTCSQAFCAVQEAMQTYQSERQVLVHHYDDAVALRGACKKLVRAAEWGPTGSSRTCPSADQVTAACTNPSIAGHIDHLKMATFCDELDAMCDSWAMWFIEAAGRQDAASLLEDGDRYSCKLFAAFNAWAWAEAPGGCEGGTPDMSAFDRNGQSTATEMSDTEWIDEEEEVDTVDSAFDVVRGPKASTHNTLQWMLLDLQFGCEDSPDESDGTTRAPVESFHVSGTQERKRQQCFQKCQQRLWCLSIDVGLADSTCKLFDWDCEKPTKSGRESWRLHRGDSGVSKTKGGRLGCDQPGYHIVSGSPSNWDCPTYLSEYTNSQHGCLLPDGPLAQCVCDANSGCGGVTTVYESGFRQVHGTKKKLVGVSGGDSSVAYTCQKVPYTVPGCSSSEAAPGDKGEGYRGCQDTTDSGKACVPWGDGWYKSIDEEKSQMGYGADFNYCRNPDKGDTIWCCTTAKCGGDDWGYCTPKAAPQLLEVGAQDHARVQTSSDELSARASSSVNLSADAILDQAVSRKGCVEAC